MSEIKNGGPAFPGKRVVNERLAAAGTAYESGMTLRDYFAAKAMQGFAVGASGFGDASDEFMNQQFDVVARISYLMANAMLRAREAK